MTHRKLIAFMLSGVFPGLGQLYNGERMKGVAFAVAGVALCWMAGRSLPTDVEALLSNPPRPAALAWLALLLIIWLWSAVDAWRLASLRDGGGADVPDRR